MSPPLSGEGVKTRPTKPFGPSLFARIRNDFYLSIGHRRATQTGLKGTKLLLGVLRESSDAFPPLKAAVGGVIALIDIYERTKSNGSAMNATSLRLDRLLGLLASRLKGDRGTVSMFVDEPYVKALTARLAILEKMKNKGLLSRVVDGAQDQEELKSICEEIEQTLQELQLNIGLRLERLTESILQETVLQNLKRAEAASYTAAVSGALSRRSCTPGTRDAIISKILDWAQSSDANAAPVYWISGLAGQGKTTIAHTICARLDALTKERYVVSYFCSRQLDTKEEKLLVSTPAFVLAEAHASYAHELLLALRRYHDLGNQELSVQVPELLIGPWNRSAERRIGLRPSVIVVDALDENDAGAKFIEHILSASREGKLPGLRILITSRPEPKIVDLCKPIDRRAICRLNEVYPHIVHNDILKYLDAELPQHRGKDYLVDVANASAGLFVYASTVVRMIRSTPRKALAEEVFMLRQVAAPSLATGYLGDKQTTILHDLYHVTITDAFNGVHPTLKDARERVLLTIICSNFTYASHDTLPILAFCADAEEELLLAVVDSLYPVLYIENGVVYWHHASFEDFILSTYESLVHCTHMRIVRCCLDILEELLRLAKSGRFTMRGKDSKAWLQKYIARYQRILELDRSDWPNDDDPNYTSGFTWQTFEDCESLDHVHLRDVKQRWLKASEFLTTLRVHLHSVAV